MVMALKRAFAASPVALIVLPLLLILIDDLVFIKCSYLLQSAGRWSFGWRGGLGLG